MVGIRSLEAADVDLIFKWRNDPYIVQLGSLKRKVTWEEHLEWFKETLREKVRKAFVLSVDGTPVGQVRFDKETTHTCFISVYLLEEHTGKGHGIDSIKVGCERIFQEWPSLKKIIAIVRNENEKGQKAFLKSGFSLDGEVLRENHKVFSLER